jgi:sugar lactone lactonase YvrE
MNLHIGALHIEHSFCGQLRKHLASAATAHVQTTAILAMTAVISALVSSLNVHAANVQYPLSIAVNEAGEIYLADRNLPGIWKIEAGKATLFFAASKQFRTPLNAVRCLAMDRQGKLLAGDSATRDVYRFDDAGQPVPLTGGGIGIPMSIAVNRGGELLVADLEQHRIWKVASGGGKPQLFAEVQAPRGLFIDADDRLWVVSHGKDQLLRIAADGQIEVVVKGTPLSFPSAVVVDASHTAYVCDTYAKAIWKVTDGKPAIWVEGAPLQRPVGLAWRGADLLIVDPLAAAVFQINPQAKLTTVFTKSP